MFLPNLVKKAVHVLCSPLSKAVNNSLLQGVFPDDAKVALSFSTWLRSFENEWNV